MKTWKQILDQKKKFEMQKIETLLKSAGLTDLLQLDPTIRKDVRYAGENNFTRKVLYKENFGLYAVKELAEAVVGANRFLQSLFPGFGIVVFDAARPLSVQKEMFDLVRNTACEPYIADPYTENPGGFHNYGLAVDLSICDFEGKLLDMGTDYDSFQEVAHSGNEQRMVEEGKLSIEAYSNRMLLYFITGKFGLLPHPLEWWHFQLDYSENYKKRHSLLEF